MIFDFWVNFSVLCSAVIILFILSLKYSPSDESSVRDRFPDWAISKSIYKTRSTTFAVISSYVWENICNFIYWIWNLFNQADMCLYFWFESYQSKWLFFHRVSYGVKRHCMPKRVRYLTCEILMNPSSLIEGVAGNWKEYFDKFGRNIIVQNRVSFWI